MLLVSMRLMGKRQLGELQPFELAITMLIANTACIPICDPDLNMLYGIIPLGVLYLMHILLITASQGSIRLRRRINGSPLIIINRDGLDHRVIQKMRLNTNDIMSALRQNGYFSPAEVSYAIMETNSKLSVLPRSRSNINSDPYMLVSEGHILDDNHELMGVSTDDTLRRLSSLNLKPKDVYLYLLDKESNAYIQPYDSHCISIRFDNNDES